MKQRLEPLTQRDADASLKALAKALASLDRAEDVRAFLEDLCTPAELEAMSDRWRVVPLLLEGVPLSDDVADFSLNLYDAAGTPTNWVLDVVLRSQVGIHAFSNTIVPRNIGGGP